MISRCDHVYEKASGPSCPGYVTGHEIMSVFASTSSAARGGEVEDSGAVTVTFDHGAVGPGPDSMWQWQKGNEGTMHVDIRIYYGP